VVRWEMRTRTLPFDIRFCMARRFSIPHMRPNRKQKLKDFTDDGSYAQFAEAVYGLWRSQGRKDSYERFARSQMNYVSRLWCKMGKHFKLETSTSWDPKTFAKAFSMWNLPTKEGGLEYVWGHLGVFEVHVWWSIDMGHILMIMTCPPPKLVSSIPVVIIPILSIWKKSLRQFQ